MLSLGMMKVSCKILVDSVGYRRFASAMDIEAAVTVSLSFWEGDVSVAVSGCRGAVTASSPGLLDSEDASSKEGVLLVE